MNNNDEKNKDVNKNNNKDYLENKNTNIKKFNIKSLFKFLNRSYDGNKFNTNNRMIIFQNQYF